MTASQQDAGGSVWKSPALHRRLLRRLRRELGRRFCIDLGPDHRSATLVAGSGRSGTSWLAEIINHRNQYHYIFEPFHPPQYDSPVPIEVGLPICADFTYHLYLRPTEVDARYVLPASRVFAGKARSPWTEQFNQRSLATRRIVKEVTANLLLPWFHFNFPGMPIVFIIRHPCAVAASRGALSWDTRWELVLSKVLQQSHLVEDFIGPYVDLFYRASTYVERQVLMWCLDNYVPLKQLRHGDMHIVFYEDLVARPEAVIPPLFAFLGQPVDPVVYDAMQSPSMLSDWNSPVLKGGNRLDSWRKKLSPQEVQMSLSILASFGLDSIYSDDPRPNPIGVEDLVSPVAAIG